MSDADGDELDDARSKSFDSPESSQSVKKKPVVEPGSPDNVRPLNDFNNDGENFTTTEADELRGGDPESVAVAIK